MILYLKRYQFADGNNLIKNDCSVDIPRYLTLNWLCDDQIELPSKQSNEVTGFLKESNIGPKLVPLATKELNQQQSSGLKNYSFSTSINQIKRKGLFESKNESNNYRNDFTCNLPVDDILNDSLPPLVDNTTKLASFDNFDEKNFILKDMSEEEQIKLALSRSLQNPNDAIMYEDFYLPKHKNDEDYIQYVDGNFDIYYDSDDNDTHVVNKNDFEEEDVENKKNNCKRDAFNRKSKKKKLY